MKKIASAALFVGALGLVACGGGGDDSPTFADSGIDGGNAAACNPVTQQGCEAGEKCGTLIESDMPVLARTACVPNGSVPPGGMCTVGDPGATTGFDDCEAEADQGFECVNGTCNEVCSRSPNSCASGACVLFEGLFDDVGDGMSTGVCAPSCDPVAQDCTTMTQGCYFDFNASAGICAGVPMPAQTATQNQPCYGPAAGACYLNGCAKGFAALVPDDPDSMSPDFLCAFFCSPTNTSMNTTDGPGPATGIQAPETQFDCKNDAGETRVGPGVGNAYECRFLNGFYADTQDVSPTIGFCVEAATWGSCTAFDVLACVNAANPMTDPACETATPGCFNSGDLPAEGRATLQKILERPALGKKVVLPRGDDIYDTQVIPQ